MLQQAEIKYVLLKGHGSQAIAFLLPQYSPYCQLWISMVDHVVVHSKDDIRVVYRDGIEK